ncbi:MAG: C25 family cysteine peptidase, partial [Pyrinomonadaceae bacterium]
WADYRRGQGFLVEVVDVADVFDEFNYGVLGADSIKSFLQYARNNWQTSPRYVLLLGDATYDPRNYQGFASQGALDYVPVKIVTTVFSETASDDAFADFNNDGQAQMAVGRIPARDAQTVTNAFNKTTTFEQASRSLNDGVLFAHDWDPATWDFPAESDRLGALLPAGTPLTKVGRTDSSGTVDPNGQQNLVNAINAGKFVVNYSGHGSTGIWFNTNFFGINDVVNCTGQPICINNPGRESIFLSLSCLNGYFIRPDADSLSEVLLKATNGGAVVVWSSTGETTPDIQEDMGRQFYSQLGTSTTMTRMGDFMLDAKTAIPGGPDVRLTFSLLGDPMLKIK